MRRVVITGMGAVTPIGNDVKEMWNSVTNEVCGIATIKQYDTTGRKVTLAGEVKDLDFTKSIDRKDLRKMDKYTSFAMVAAKEAMQDSGLDMEQENRERMGVIVSSGIGGLGTIEKDHSRGLEKGFDRISPYFIPMSISNMAAGNIAIAYGLQGICTCVVTACASGSNAVGEAFHKIRDGYADLMLCGGTEASITPLGIGGFTALKALNETTDANRASIPFDKERSGFVMGEGAGILILEEYQHAKARNAKIYGEMIGYASNCDAYHITAPVTDGSGAAKCMELALKDAKLEKNKVDYINAHGTSTSMNDSCETAAIKGAFGDHARKLMVSSTKSMTGHLLGASGAVEAIITTLGLKEGYVPATINYQMPDEACDLDVVPGKGRKENIAYAMSNSLGFGGHNASIIVKKYEE